MGEAFAQSMDCKALTGTSSLWTSTGTFSLASLDVLVELWVKWAGKASLDKKDEPWASMVRMKGSSSGLGEGFEREG